MKRLMMFMVIALPLAAQALTISGTVTGGSGLRIAAALPAAADTYYVGIVIPFVNTYSITVPAGNYIVAAFADENSNLTIDPGEPIGWWGGNFPDLVVVNANVGGINMSLSAVNNGSFSGLLSYGGSLMGAGFVRVFDNPNFTGDPVGGGLLFDVQTGNGVYIGLTTSLGTFYADGFMDMNGNLAPDPGEPYGIYGGETAQSFDVLSSVGPADIDIDLLDDVTAPVEDLTVARDGDDAVLSWSYGGSFTGFKIYRSVGPNGDPLDGTLLTTTASMTFTDVNVLGTIDDARYVVVVER